MKPKIVNIGVTIAATSGGASGTVLYTCPTRFTAEVNLLNVMNPSGGSLDATLQVYDSKSTNYYTFVDTFAVTHKHMLTAVSSGTKLHLDEGDKIIASASSASALKAFASIIETYSEVTR